MREIKFRAWDKDRMVKGFELFEDNSAYRGAIPMQFTGLLDKNGKEIYESDLVKHSDYEEPLEVFYCTDCAQFRLQLRRFGNNEALDPENDEVIGNAYES